MAANVILYYPSAPIVTGLALIGCSNGYKNAPSAPVPDVVAPAGMSVGDLLIFGSTGDGSSAPGTGNWSFPGSVTMVPGGEYTGTGFATSLNWGYKTVTAGDIGATFSFGASANSTQSTSFLVAIANGSNVALAQAGNSISGTSLTLASDSMPANSIRIGMLGVTNNSTTGSASANLSTCSSTAPNWGSGYIGTADYTTPGASGATTWTVSASTNMSTASLIIT